jgi:AraC-like DNA-binding protein
MKDRLADLLKHFELRARVFQTGPLCHTSLFDQADGLSYIHVLQRGGLVVRSPSHSAFTLYEPHLLLYMRPTSHRLFPQPGAVETATVCASFEFGAGVRNPLIVALPDVVCLPLKQMPTLTATLELIFREADASHCGRQLVLNRLMEIIVVQVLRDLMDQKRLQAGLLAGLADAQLMKAINAMHTRPAERWSLQRLADTAGMSRARFAGRFHEVVGMTPGSYLADWRLSLVQSLLRKGRPLQLIADDVGYANASALSRAFRARLGTSPIAWLKSVSNPPSP